MNQTLAGTIPLSYDNFRTIGMKLFTLTPITSLAALAAGSLSLCQRQSTLDDFIGSERDIALQGVLNNIGGGGSLVPGADPGIVVASPSRENPDYFFTWTRDSALTLIMLVDEYVNGDISLQNLIEDYIDAQAILQTVTNPSGTLYPAGLGLGEPKFYTNKTRFDGTWGRPQRDGPALRAIALLEYSNSLLESGEGDRVRNVIWPIIYNDLLYVGQYWNQTGYDLWEEVQGTSFFTIVTQHRALVQGSMIADEIDLDCAPCGQAPQVLCFLSSNFWNATGGYLTADVNVSNVNRSGINTDPILGSIHGFDIEAPCDAKNFQPCNSYSLATLKVVVDSFRDIYPINNGIPIGQPLAVGRYPEDTYFGGNPWYLTTLAVAEFLYDGVAQFEKAESLTIDEINLAFFKDIYPDAETRAYRGSDLDNVLARMINYADGFVSVVQQYTPPNGSLSEQINKNTGEPLSAYDLTWSYASFITMAQRRDGQYVSWGYNEAEQPPATCSATSYNATGQYTPATAAGAPDVDRSCASQVEFSVIAPTAFGQNVYLVGNTTLLGGAVNDPSAIILPMNPGRITPSRPEWFIDIYLPAGVPVEYQYVLQQTDGSFTFDSTTYVVDVSPCGGRLVKTEDNFVTGS